ncbi:MAG: RlpA-like double-psi beta-barrel domain-containing protein [Dehalococcoidia bacterium]
MALAAAALAAGAPPAPADAAAGPTVELLPGWNAAVWWGGSTDVDAALGGLPLTSAFTWDVENQSWLAYAPDSPHRDFATVEHAMPLWLNLQAATSWQQGPLPLGLPNDVTLPFGWSLLSFIGEQMPVWEVLGEDFQSPVREALRWNPFEQAFISYRPGFSAEELFAILHPGDVFWAQTIISDIGWNPAYGLASDPIRGRRLVRGEATFLYEGLHGNPMYCGGIYNRFDPTIAAATSWPCGTRLRVWRDDRFVDVVVQDVGVLPAYHLDLSEAAFEQIGTLVEGRLSVLIEELPSPPPE